MEGRPCMHVTQRSLRFMSRCYNICKQHAVIKHPYKQQICLYHSLLRTFALRHPVLSSGHVQWLKSETYHVTQLLEDEPVALISQPAAAAVLFAHGTTAGLGCACYTTSSVTCNLLCIQIVSTMATTSLEDVAKASKGSPLLIFQLYVQRDRDFTASLIRSKTHIAVG